MIHKNTKIIASISIIFLAVCITISFFFIQKVTAQKSTLATKTQERMAMLERERSLDALTQALSETESERAFMVSRILQEDDVIDFLALINNLGREQGATLVTNSLKVSPLDKDQTFELLVLQIGLEGTYASITQLIALFEYIPYQSSLTKLRISQDDQGVWSASFELSVTKFKKT